MDILVGSLWLLLAFLLLISIVNRKMGNKGGIAATSVFTDMQNQEKRNAMETVIEEKTGKKRFGQETNEPQSKSL